MKKALAIILSITLLLGLCPFAVSAAEEEPACLGPQAKLIDDFGWGEAYVYAWDADGYNLLGEWPGTPVAQTETTVDGKNVFVADIPYGADGIIFSSFTMGYCVQTADITDFSNEYFRMDGTTNVDGHYNVVGLSEYVPDDKEIRFQDNLNWGEAYVYACDEDGNELTGEWPGTKVTETITNDYGATVFCITFPYATDHIIISNGKGDRTEEINYLIDDMYWLNGEKNGNGEYLVNQFSPPLPDPNPVTIMFENSFLWEDVYVYAWDEEGNSLTNEWPGDEVTEFEVNVYGQKVYTIAIDSKAEGIVVNNGSGEQTVDITDLTYDYYYMDGTQDEMYHYNVKGFVYGYDPENDVIGDVNGDKNVDVLDAAQIQKYAAGKTELTKAQLIKADVNNDKTVDILDATEIQKFAVSKITEFKKK